MSTPVGTLLSGRYRLDAQVGTGGMSTVYLAFDTVLERPVAIKLMHREIASDSSQLERFRREARAVAQLNHPHIVGVIDAGDDGDGESSTPYIVFEYVEGETLKERIVRGGRLPIADAAAYALELARALQAAHQRKIVHRDVKPQNVLLDSEGSAKITDFGIHRTLTEEGLTADGRVLGTTDYVSPEQALGQQVTGQSDVYSLGILLYEMLTGTVPFRAENAVAVAMKHVREELPDVQSRRPEISAALASVVDRATAKDIRYRYPDAQSMASDLEEALAIEASRAGAATGEVTSVLRTLPGSARRRLPLRARQPAWLLLAGMLATALLIGGLLFLILRHTHRGVAPTPAVSVPGLRAVPLAADAAHSYNPYGDRAEDADLALAIDGQPQTVWTTQYYLGGTLGKPGDGLYLDANPVLAARELEVQTPTPGFSAKVYGANSILDLPFGNKTPLPARGWTLLAGQGNGITVARDQPIALATGSQRYRYYLLWMTSLPPNSQSISIDELTLFAPGGSGRPAGATGAIG